MAFWVQETRRKDKEPYPPNTLMALSAGLKRYMEECGRVHLQIFAKQDTVFYHFRQALDARMKSLTKDGIGIHKKTSDPVELDEEKEFWRKDVFTMDTAEGLSNAVFFYNGKCFAFRSFSDHANCEAGMYYIGYDAKSKQKILRYQEGYSKTNQGGLDNCKVNPKEIIHFADPSNERCIVKLFEAYLQLIPAKGEFYRKPRQI